ncbi:hypothetical protein FA95DRAFT_1013348 [Auriscalpium vulgare]|uniref:Uncharacterized protein n=1 Tax=Auriscalpium vulgare TaxID=40419 RepID=A0ACB8R7F3_9AGAM|nr:hypothetical protein FA95DRAFT_1013348 [Auriscalpium vulgare]
MICESKLQLSMLVGCIGGVAICEPITQPGSRSIIRPSAGDSRPFRVFNFSSLLYDSHPQAGNVKITGNSTPMTYVRGICHRIELCRRIFAPPTEGLL